MLKPFANHITRSRRLIIIWCLMASLQILGGEMVAASQEIRTLNPDSVGIAPNGIRVPIGIILLIRKNTEYCAIKFTKFWTGETQDDEYATYESYYQGDRTGDFKKKNTIFKQGKLSRPRLRGIGRLSFSFGTTDIQCGPIKLFWSGKGWVYFFNSSQNQGDYGIELAPSKWTDISQVNVFDSRLRWYRYDESRKDVILPVDRLWEDKPIEGK
jgi:hypothetical protein